MSNTDSAPSTSVIFVSASESHLQGTEEDIRRIQAGGGVARASTQAGIAADIKRMSVAHGRGGIGLSSSSIKRGRSEDDGCTDSLEHCSVLQLLFPHEAVRSVVGALRVAESANGAAVAYLLPMKWSFVHVVILPLLPSTLCYGMDSYPRGWDGFMTKTASHPDVRARCLGGMVELRNRVVSLLCSEPNGVAAILLKEGVVSNLRGRCGNFRWCGEAELAKAQECFLKKRSDGALQCPIRVGLIAHDGDPLLNAPALHVLSSDGFYTTSDVVLWHSMFSDAFVDASPRRTAEEDIRLLHENGSKEAELTILDRLARRKRLSRCTSIPCPLCGKSFECLADAARHWLGRCLPSATASVQLGKALYL